MAEGRLTSPLAQRWGLGATTGAPAGSVYIGQDYTAPYTGGTPTGGYGSSAFAPLDAAAQAWASLSPTAQQKVYNDAIAVYGHEKIPSLNMPSFYADTVRSAYQVQQSTGLKVTPLEYWDYYKQSGGPGLNAYGAGGKGGGAGGPKTSTSTSVSLTDPDTARGLIENAIGSELGRRPTEKEYATFMKALTTYAEANPTVTTTNSNSGKGFSTSSQKSSGGYNAQQFAKDYANAQEGAAETDVATTGFDAFISLIGG